MGSGAPRATRTAVGSGHNVVKTVFMECHASYRTDGPEHLRSLGEVEYVRGIAERTARLKAEIAQLLQDKVRFEYDVDAYLAANPPRY